MVALPSTAPITLVDMDAREQIKARLHELGKSHYWLVQQVKEDMSANAVYSYLRGTTDMKGENLGKLFAVLDLELTPKRKR